MTNKKIHTIEELARISDQLKKDGKTVAYCHGEFDLLHFGHLRHFKEAARQADVLIVTLTPDRFINKGPGRPVYNENYRAEFISSLECVGYVGINEWPTAEKSLEAIKPSIYCKGNEYVHQKDVTGRITVEKELVESLGGRLHFTEDVVFSSSELSKRHFNVFPPEAMEFLKTFGGKNDRHSVIQGLETLKQKKVAVIGVSLLVDESEIHAGKDFRCAIQKRRYSQGAIASANRLAQFCGDVTLLHTDGSNEDDLREFLDNRVRFVNIGGCTSSMAIEKKIYRSHEGTLEGKTEVKAPKALRSCKSENLLESVVGNDFVFLHTKGKGSKCVNHLQHLLRERNIPLAFLPESEQKKGESGQGGSSLFTFDSKPETQNSKLGQGARDGISFGLNGETVLSLKGKRFLVPSLSGNKTKNRDAEIGAFTIASCGYFAGWEPETVGFIAAALLAMGRETSQANIPVEPMSLSKYLIALLK